MPRQAPDLARCFAYLVLTVSVLQGTNQILRVWLPLDWIGMSTSGGAVAEAVGLSGIIVGLALVAM